MKKTIKWKCANTGADMVHVFPSHFIFYKWKLSMLNHKIKWHLKYGRSKIYVPFRKLKLI